GPLLRNIFIFTLAKEMGNEEKLFKYNGVLYPTVMCPEENLRALYNITAREDDILLVAYPKCGDNYSGLSIVLELILTTEQFQLRDVGSLPSQTPAAGPSLG
uniref:Uncharacterized protein n=1 Tax=Anabas testudineus TaxID=64144 RepID=A0A7N5ZXR8_ANATE